jgi:hypothetical protein
VKRTPGRPPLDEDDPSVKMSVSLPSKKFDELCALARRQDMSLPEVIRRLIYGNTYQLIEKKPKK